MSAGTRALTSAEHKTRNAKRDMEQAKTTEARMKAQAVFRREMFALAAIREKLEREAGNVNGKNHG